MSASMLRDVETLINDTGSKKQNVSNCRRQSSLYKRVLLMVFSTAPEADWNIRRELEEIAENKGKSVYSRYPAKDRSC